MKSNYVFGIAVLSFAMVVSGCAGRAMEPKAPEPEKVERAIEVEENSFSDYSVRAGHWAVETSEGVSEAAEDGWEWMREKKNRAKKWVHEKTESEE